MATSLSNLPAGTHIRLTGFAANSDYTTQLEQLGLVPGTTATILRHAPLGDPMEIRIRGYSLVLRPSEANELIFKVITP